MENEKKLLKEEPKKQPQESELSKIFSLDYNEFQENTKNEEFKNYQEEFNKFYKYLQHKYGENLENMLGKDGKNWLENITLEEIKNKKIKIGYKGRLTEEEKKLFKSGKTEKQAIEESLMKLDELSKNFKKQDGSDIDFDTFLTNNNIEKKSDGIILLKNNSKIKNANELKKLFFMFLQNEQVNLDSIEKHNPEFYNELINISELKNNNRDETEKVMITTSVRKLYEKIKQEGNKTIIKKFENNDKFKDWINGIPHRNSRPANNDGNRFELMYNELINFINENFNKEEKRKLINFNISFNDLYKTGKDIGIWENNKNINEKISEGNDKFYKIVKKIAPLYITRDFIKAQQYSAEKIKKIMNLYSPKITGLQDLLSRYKDKIPEHEENFLGPNANKYRDSFLKKKKEKDIISMQLSKENDENKKIELKEKLEILETEIEELLKKMTEGSENESFWMNYIKLFEHDELGLYEVLKKLKENNFDFNKISKSEQNILSKALIKEQIENIDKENNFPIEIDKKAYKQFLNDIFDINKEEATIYDGNGKKIKIKFSRDMNSQEQILMKGFIGNPIKKPISVSSFLKNKKFPFGVSIDLIESDPEVEPFLYKTLSVFMGDKSPLWKFGGTIYSNNYKVNIKNKKTSKKDFFGTGYLSPSPPFSLTDEEKKILDNNKENNHYDETIYIYDYPVNLPLPKGKTRKLLGAIYGLEDLKNYEIDIINKDLFINGDGIKGLTNSFLFAKNIDEIKNTNMTNINEQSGELENIFKDTNKENEEDYNNIIEDNKSNFEKNKKPDEVWKSIPGFADEKMEIGDQFVVNSGHSLEGPGYGYYHYALKITDIKENEIILKIKGLHGELGGTEGKIIKIPNNEEGLNKLKNFYTSKGGIWKFKNQNKIKDFDEYIGKCNDEGNFGDEETKAINLLQSVSRDGKKFVDKDDNKREMVFYINDNTDLGYEKSHQIIMLNIEKGGNGKFNIKYEYLRNGKQDKNGKKKKEIYKYGDEFETDYAGFIMFLKTKGDNISLGEKNIIEEKIKEEKKGTNNKDGLPKKLKTYQSISSIIGGIKKIFGKYKSWRNESDEEKISDFEYWAMGGPKGRASKLGRIPIFGEGFTDIHLKYQNERDNIVYKKIEGFANREFSTDMHHSYIILPRIVPLISKFVNIETGEFTGKQLNTKDRYKMIAAMMYMLKKEKGLYRRALAPLAGKGIFIKTIFGEATYQHFITIRNKKLSEKGNDDNLSDLMTLEIDIMIDQLRGGEHFQGGELNKKHNAIFSRKLAGELDGLKNGLTEEDSWQGEYKAKLEVGFPFIVEEFEGCLAKNQIQKAMGILLAMYQKAQNDKEYDIVKRSATMFLLTKSFYFETNYDLKDLFDKKFRSMKYPLLMLHMDENQDKDTANILNLASGGIFFKIFDKNILEKISGYDTRGGETKRFINKFKSFRDNNQIELKKFLSIENIEDDKNLISITNNTEIKEYKGINITPGIRNSLKKVYGKYQEGSRANISELKELSDYESTYDDVLYTSSFNMCASMGRKPDDEAGIKRYDAYRSKMVKQTGDLSSMGKLNKLTKKSEFNFLITKFLFIFAIQFKGDYLGKLLQVINKAQEIAKKPPIGYNANIEGPRMIADYIWGQIYAGGEERLDTPIRDSLRNYTDFICNNYDMFDNNIAKEMGDIHDINDADQIFQKGKHEMAYIDAKKRESMKYDDKNKLIYEYKKQGKELINGTIWRWNKDFTGKGSINYRSKAINQSVDSMTTQGQKYIYTYGNKKNMDNEELESSNLSNEEKELIKWSNKQKGFTGENPLGINISNRETAESIKKTILEKHYKTEIKQKNNINNLNDEENIRDIIADELDQRL